MLKYCNYNEEIKENDNFIVNKRFEEKNLKKWLFIKRQLN